MTRQMLSNLALALALISQASLAMDTTAPPTNPVVAALLDGKAHVHLRYRYEHVDDELVPADDAHASTLRAALGWESGIYRGFSVYAEMEHVSAVVLDDYKEGPGPVDAGNARYPVVADPAGTELNEAYLNYAAGDWWGLKLGRQIVTYRDAPLHRFMGTVLWRQNWQTHDGASIWIKPSDGLELRYAYSAQVNRIFGDDAPDPFDDFDCDCHLFNAQYRARDFLKFEAYGYLLDIENAPVNSLDTFGIRVWGAYPLTPAIKVLYAAEYANQDDAAGNPRSVDADYYLGELGAAFVLPSTVMPDLVFKFDYEVLQGNGATSFQTPLATGHAFQGWADRFLITPSDGIEDFYLTAIASLAGGKLIIAYHQLESDRFGYDYGDEIDIEYTYRFARYWTFGAKAAIYEADRNATALTRAGGEQNNDVTKVWAWLQFDY